MYASIVYLCHSNKQGHGMRQRIEVIQVLRGVGALLVCFFHMRSLLNTASFAYGNFLFGSGAIGVPLFFIISGFVLIYTHHPEKYGVGAAVNFSLKRLIRIVPLYFILTLIYIVGLSQVSYYLHHTDALVRTFTFLPQLTRTTAPSFGFPPIVVGWTLTYEMLFYALFAVSILLKRGQRVFLLAVFAGLLLIMPLVVMGSIHFDFNYVYGFSYRYLEVITNGVWYYFIAGLLLGYLYRSSFSVPRNVILYGLLPLSILLFMVVYFGALLPFSGVWNNLVACSLLFFSLVWLHRYKPVAVAKPFIFLGDISYSLFLVHPLVIVFLGRLLRLVGLESWTSGYAFFILCMVLILGISYLSYSLVEQKLHRWLSAKLL